MKWEMFEENLSIIHAVVSNLLLGCIPWANCSSFGCGPSFFCLWSGASAFAFDDIFTRDYVSTMTIKIIYLESWKLHSWPLAKKFVMHHDVLMKQGLGPALPTLKAFSRKLGCDWLMLKHQPITTKLVKSLLVFVMQAPGCKLHMEWFKLTQKMWTYNSRNCDTC